MSAASVFNLLANDGKPDRLTLATALLNQRIKDVACRRRAAGVDPTPTLLDLEKTHVLHVNAHFKPMAALAFEYNKAQSQSGSAAFGGDLTYSIPQFGDFFHDMVFHARLGPAFCSNNTAVTAGADSATITRGAQSILPANNTEWDTTADTTITYSVVDAFGNELVASPAANIPVNTYRNMVRYVEFPAERLFEEIRFEVNGNPLDDYTWEHVIMLRKFCLSDEKLHGYKRLVGQETEIEGFTGPRACPLLDTDHSATTPAAAPGHGLAGAAHGSIQNIPRTDATYQVAQEASSGSGGNFAAGQWNPSSTATTGAFTEIASGSLSGKLETGESVQYLHVQRGALKAVDGLQTPKYWQPGCELWNRLWMWFNLDARLSIPSVSIPYGQRFIRAKLAAQENVIVDYPGAFVRQQVTVPADMTTGTLVNGSTVVNFRPYWQASTIGDVAISKLDLYINNIFVNPEVHDIFIRRVAFSLIRVFRRHSQPVATGDGQLLLSSLKWPIEYLLVGFQPLWNRQNSPGATTQGSSNPEYHRDWHRMGKTFNSVCELRQSSSTSHTDSAGAGSASNTSSIGQIVPDTYVVERPVVYEISLIAHGIPIVNQLPEKFHSAYVPFHFGGDAVRPSKDPGALMINFALFPGCYQPSGYLNTSRARELFVHWKSLYGTTGTTTVQCIAIAVAINFLLVSDGSAVLRFST